MALQSHYVEGQRFDKTDFTTTPWVSGEYENCTFVHAVFAGVDLSGSLFIDCQFTACDLSLAKLAKTAFRDVVFKDCKMLGMLFTQCHDFGLSLKFQQCILNHSSFYNLKLKKTPFNNCTLQDVDFTNADLTAATFDGCDLQRALFENTMLEKADLRHAFNYSIDPEKNYIRNGKFALAGLPGLLDKHNIHIE